MTLSLKNSSSSTLGKYRSFCTDQTATAANKTLINLLHLLPLLLLLLYYYYYYYYYY